MTAKPACVDTVASASPILGDSSEADVGEALEERPRRPTQRSWPSELCRAGLRQSL